MVTHEKKTNFWVFKRKILFLQARNGVKVHILKFNKLKVK